MKKNLLLSPGPTQIPADICAELGKPIIHHRTPQFKQILAEVLDGLKKICQTESDVYLLTSSGTGAMEAAVCNLVGAGDKTITVEGGKFGERWTELCKTFGAEPTVIEVPWGSAVTAEQIKAQLDANKDVKAVFVTLSETSTGVVTDVEAIAKVVKETNAVLVVDAISGLGVVDLKMDAWGVDVVVSGSQKGFMLPPGIAFIAVNDKAMAMVQECPTPRYYFDLRKSKKVIPDTPFTPAIGIIVALNEVLKQFLEVGTDGLFARYARLAEGTRAAAKALKLGLLAEDNCISNALTSICIPDGVDGGKVVKMMRDDYGITVAGGQAQLKGKIIRMAHMGCVDEYDILAGIACLEKVLKQLGYSFEMGAGVAAAQDVFNK